MNAAAPVAASHAATLAVGATMWTLLTVIGFVLLKSVKRWGKPWMQAVSVRLAAVAFVAAGTIGASGWIGQAQSTGIGIANQQGNNATAHILGAGVIWILWLLACVSWIAGLVPESWFDFEIPDWLSISGLFLPSLSAFMPGAIGNFFGGLFDALGGALIGLITGIGG